MSWKHHIMIITFQGQVKTALYFLVKRSSVHLKHYMLNLCIFEVKQSYWNYFLPLKTCTELTCWCIWNPAKCTYIFPILHISLLPVLTYCCLLLSTHPLIIMPSMHETNKVRVLIHTFLDLTVGPIEPHWCRTLVNEWV